MKLCMDLNINKSKQWKKWISREWFLYNFSFFIQNFEKLEKICQQTQNLANIAQNTKGKKEQMCFLKTHFCIILRFFSRFFYKISQNLKKLEILQKEEEKAFFKWLFFPNLAINIIFLQSKKDHVSK